MGSVDYLDYKLWKLALMGLAVFVWGIICGLNGRNLLWEPLDKE
jgi:hypothetical protein